VVFELQLVFQTIAEFPDCANVLAKPLAKCFSVAYGQLRLGIYQTVVVVVFGFITPYDLVRVIVYDRGVSATTSGCGYLVAFWLQYRMKPKGCCPVAPDLEVECGWYGTHGLNKMFANEEAARYKIWTSTNPSLYVWSIFWVDWHFNWGIG
jgi:hypothetical protein